MSDPELKVTDKRMFTPEGELREEFRHLEETVGGAPDAEAPAAEVPAAEVPATSGTAVAGTSPGGGTAPGGAFPEPTFYDLLAVLAEPASLYLGDAALPDGRRIEDLGLARLHIDLLALLQRKTAGQLDGREAAALDDLLYRLRMRYVEKSR